MYAVFDGHGGREVAAFCEHHMPSELLTLARQSQEPLRNRTNTRCNHNKVGGPHYHYNWGYGVHINGPYMPL